MSVDKRVHPRAQLELRVVYPRLNAFIADYTHNLSKGGTFIRTGEPLAMGSELEFQLSTPAQKEPFRLRGKVVWITRPDQAKPESPAGMGVMFVWEDDTRRVAFEEAVTKVIDDALGPELRKQLEGRGDE